ncbi:MAG TPA: nodulation protein NfeD, partial [Actinomycetota bacterium]
MKRTVLALISLGIALAPAMGAHGHAGQHVVHVVALEGVIDPTSAEYLAERVTEAGQEGAEAVIIQLDTPGGLDVSMRDMVQEILRSRVPVIVWVGPPGARAASAGVFLVYASHVAAMAPGTNVGAAHPVDLGGDLSGAAEAKAVNDAAALLRSLAEQRGRDVGFAEDAIRESASLTAVEAERDGVVEVLATSIPDLLGRLNGMRVSAAGGARTLVTEATEDQSVVVRFFK